MEISKRKKQYFPSHFPRYETTFKTYDEQQLKQMFRGLYILEMCDGFQNVTLISIVAAVYTN
jgi:hypothetical protein